MVGTENATRARTGHHAIDAARVRELLTYDPDTGVFRWRFTQAWRTNPSRIRSCAGEVAGHVDRGGYISIWLDRKPYRAHRLAWLLVFGVLPDREIDHTNGEPADNRIANLRLADKQKNAANTGLRRDNKSGFKGVAWQKRARKWVAGIRVNNKSIHLGLYDDPAEAHAAYAQAAGAYFGEFARLR